MPLKSYWQHVRSTYLSTFWDVITWLVIVSMFLWAMGKSLGWINTPVFIEILPIFAGFFLAGRFFQRFEQLSKDFASFKHEMYSFKNEMYHFKGEMYDFKEKMYDFKSDTKFEFAALSKRISGIGAKL